VMHITELIGKRDQKEIFHKFLDLK